MPVKKKRKPKQKIRTRILLYFVPVIRNSKRDFDTRVSLKGALGESGVKSGTREATE